MATVIPSPFENLDMIAPRSEFRAAATVRIFVRRFVWGAVLTLVLLAGLAAATSGGTAIEREALEAEADSLWYWAAADVPPPLHP